MSSLADKLKALGVEVSKPQGTQPQVQYPIEKVVPGRLAETPYGQTFVVEQTYLVDLQHGCATLQIDAPIDTVAEWAQEPRLVELGTETFGFLDIETTSLARGTGTYAFMVGAARYDGDFFRLAQFLLRDPAEEPAQLAALWSFLEPCQALVTFNGKTFDLPILRARCVANEQPFPLEGRPHVDLLGLARRLWRDRLPSRAMGCLEDQILGLPRAEEDVPGWMIPGLYFDYLQDGDARPLKGVFYHNAVDVLSMAALLGHIAALLADPLDSELAALDQVDMGKLFEDLGHVGTAAQLYERALARKLPDDTRARAVQRWSFLEKRRDDLQTAMRLWHEAAASGEIYAHVELAKAYEPRLHNYQGAAFWTQLAIDRVSEPNYPKQQRERWAGELAHRLARLQRKLTSGSVDE
jgi:uncharacterized protein YprB with RNaseH-like and TPR domain